MPQVMKVQITNLGFVDDPIPSQPERIGAYWNQKIIRHRIKRPQKTLYCLYSGLRYWDGPRPTRLRDGDPEASEAL